MVADRRALVERVARDRRADVREVRADLVHAAGVARRSARARASPVELSTDELGVRGEPVGVIDARRDCRAARAARRTRARPGAPSVIARYSLSTSPLPNASRSARYALGGARGDEHARRADVEPMDEPTVARVVADRGALRPPRGDRVRDRAELAGAQRLRRHARRACRRRSSRRARAARRARSTDPAAARSASPLHRLARELDTSPARRESPFFARLPLKLDVAGRRTARRAACAGVGIVPRERLVDATLASIGVRRSIFIRPPGGSRSSMLFGCDLASPRRAARRARCSRRASDRIAEPCFGCGCAIRCSPLRSTRARMKCARPAGLAIAADEADRRARPLRSRVAPCIASSAGRTNSSNATNVETGLPGRPNTGHAAVSCRTRTACPASSRPSTARARRPPTSSAART